MSSANVPIRDLICCVCELLICVLVEANGVARNILSKRNVRKDLERVDATMCAGMFGDQSEQKALAKVTYWDNQPSIAVVTIQVQLCWVPNTPFGRQTSHINQVEVVADDIGHDVVDELSSLGGVLAGLVHGLGEH